MPLQWKGARVKLNARGRAVAGTRKQRDRRGVVVALCRDAEVVKVQWEGTLTPQAWAKNYLTGAHQPFNSQFGEATP